MSGILQLDYYYGIEAEQFSFYRVPRLLIKDERFKKLSSDAKLLIPSNSRELKILSEAETVKKLK